jgi:hypothetical protein
MLGAVVGSFHLGWGWTQDTGIVVGGSQRHLLELSVPLSLSCYLMGGAAPTGAPLSWLELVVSSLEVRGSNQPLVLER